MCNHNNSPLRQILEQNKKGYQKGVFSICSANPYVIRSGIKAAHERDSFVLIESTCNQVNQFGGYSGMTPLVFRRNVESMANELNFPLERLILGGDHLGPFPWRNMSGVKAMQTATQMVREYAAAGYQKIHLDASMHCGDDYPSLPLSKETAVARVVQMCRVIENETSLCKGLPEPLYVIGTEVPVPGGQEEVEANIVVTSVADVDETIMIHRRAFQKAGLASAWDRVIAVVVQPGVEFNETGIIDYQSNLACELKKYIETIPGLVFEAHSTDYQTTENLRRLVADHFAILKVGPALTFALREALLGLAHIEQHLAVTGKIAKPAKLFSSVEEVMNKNPANWEKYFPDDADLEITKVFGYSDRIRYYWDYPQVQDALKELLENLESVTIPAPLISQYFPQQYKKFRLNALGCTAGELIIDHIQETISEYSQACGQ